MTLLGERGTSPLVFLTRAAIVTALAALAGCQVAPTPPPAVAPPQGPARAVFTPTTYRELPGWNDDRQQAAWPAFRVGCKALVARSRTQALWQAPCSAADAVDEHDANAVRNFFEENFTPYRVTASDGDTSGLVTGYYEPLLRGSRTASPSFPAPLYTPPDDLLIVELSDLYPELKGKRVRGRLDGRHVVPYWARADIDAGKANTNGNVLVYVSDPVDAFFLQIQGSGRVQLDDGGIMRVGYADQNGQPFRSVARVLIDRGELTLGEASMQGIREWGRRHPDQLPALLDENPSYVFFREVPPPQPGSLEAKIDGPIGSLGVPLLAERTIAVDPRAIPLGAPVFLATTEPLFDERRSATPRREFGPLGGSAAAVLANATASVGRSYKPLQRLVMAQDTGGAIRGPIRADFFWGFGDEAGQQAGRMRQQAEEWLLWPNGAPPPAPRSN
ncbi:MAG: murein transglycosylase A [Casimicrobiaceae bacterium]